MSEQNRYKEYDTWAWLYNQTMGPQYCKNQLQPLEKMLLPRLPQQAKILDLGCGTGHLMQQLLDRGYQVTGLDGSEAMLFYAHQNAPKAESILVDLRNFTLPPSFDAVFSTSASLNHIMSLEEIKKVFRNVYGVLRESGFFLFDINHPGQMQKWWRGQIAEGEIQENYAWAIVPNYNSADRTGNFKVIIFKAPSHKNKSFNSVIKKGLRRLVYELLSLGRLTRFRLKLLSKFQAWEKDWQRTESTYFVKGYSDSEIKAALAEVGFVEIDICTIEGNSEINNDRSAYFICRKREHVAMPSP